MEETPADGDTEEEEEVLDELGAESDEEPGVEEPAPKVGWKRQGILLLRDIGIAILIVLMIMGVIMAYTQVWPPMVVIESGSMEHSSAESSVGVIDTGDLVLVQKAESRDSVVTYVQGRATGYGTYGEFGDVLIYHRGGNQQTTPIIHRAILYLEWNETATGWDVPGLASEYWMDRLGVEWGGTNMGQAAGITAPFGLNGTLWINNTGFRHANLTLALQEYNETDSGQSGYVTAGDNNVKAADNTGRCNGPWDCPLVRQSYVVGKARGELPWFGLIKLSISGQIPWGKTCPATTGHSNCAHGNSWSSLTVSLVLLFVVPIGTDLGFTYLSRLRAKRASRDHADEEE